MQGTMMRFPLTLAHLLERARRLYARSEIVSRLPDQALHRYTYREFHERTLALASALQRIGLSRGDRVATLMWNHHAHLEAYFAVPCAGGVLHTLNLRLHPSDIAYIANHARDRFLIVDDVLLPLYEQFRDQVSFERVIVTPLSGGEPAAAGYDDYENLVAARNAPILRDPDENDAAGLCYTSGTTGRPKGVVYSHRALVLHSLASALPDALAVSNGDTVCPVVPMFHVNAWGLPFTAVMLGAKLVFPGPHLDAESLIDLFARERVTLAAGVPTIWAGVLQALEKKRGRRALVQGMRLVAGGAAAPEPMIRAFDKFGLRVVHGWGMTETTPVGTVNFIRRELARLDPEELYPVRAKQGVPLPFFEVRAVTDAGEAPWDGATPGELQVRGPWVAASYHDLAAERDKWTPDGWLRTGDVATIDSHGYVKITDRIKDLIKSGGEWISSLDLENALAGHPAVQEAAVIAIPHVTWGERPLAVVVRKPGHAVSTEELRRYLEPKFAKFWLPDAFAFVDEIPRTSTGKMMKVKLREQFRDWRWD
ncbi:MAG: long-chain fatty acid--CoA ligase [Betaproteobacteria bacterium]|nr:long-chain fatty acid--CoA ligase [Betaproteobacteria bacterium]